jgi:HlyD family secretion protein
MSTRNYKIMPMPAKVLNRNIGLVRVLSPAVMTLLMLTGIFLTGCERNDETKAKKGKQHRVKTSLVERVTMTETIETTGDVVAANTVTIESTVEGPIAFCPWREGDRIATAGDKLIAIERPLYKQEVMSAKADLAAARAELADLKAGARDEEIAQAQESVRQFEDCTEFAKADYDRIKSLVSSGSLPAEAVEKARVSYIKCQSEFNSAKHHLDMLKAGPTETEIAVAEAAVIRSQAKVDLAQARLDECLIKAPFAGVVTQVYVRPGDLAAPRARLIKIMDPSSLVVRAGIPESSAAAVHEGTKVNIRLDAFTGRDFEAEIERVYPNLEPMSRTRIVEIRITDPVELMPNLFARVRVQGRVFQNTLVVPDSAIITTPRGTNLIFVVEDGKAHAREVQTGIQEGNIVQIVEGLNEGNTIVIEGNLNLKDGASVNTGETQPLSQSAGNPGGDE